jgi:hypothetical protein
VAWRKPVDPPHIEAPEWYRNFHPESWDEPDGQEQAMMDGCSGYRCWPDSPDSAWPGWPQWLHEAHAERRWHQAQYRYRQEHPALAEQEFLAIVSGEWRSRRRERNA